MIKYEMPQRRTISREPWTVNRELAAAGLDLFSDAYISSFGVDTITFTAPSDSIVIGLAYAGYSPSPMTVYIDDVLLEEVTYTYRVVCLDAGALADRDGGKYDFGFNSQLRVPEIHSDHYTAEFWEYDPRIGSGGRWNTDPKSYLYPGLSPYHVMGNNPIYFIDPKGDTLKVSVGEGDNKETFEYRRGKFYDSNNKLYTNGAYATTDKKGNTTYTGFLGEAQAALYEIGSKRNGAILLSTLIESEHNYTIVEKLRNRYFKESRTIWWNPSENHLSHSNDVEGGTSTPAFISLVHELGHAYDNEKNGWSNFVTVWNYAYYNGGPQPHPNSEKIALHIENIIRAEHNIPLRENYTNVNNQEDFRVIQNETNRSTVIGVFSPSFPYIVPFEYGTFGIDGKWFMIRGK